MEKWHSIVFTFTNTITAAWLLQLLQLVLVLRQGLIFTRTEKGVKIIINANILIKQEEVVKH